MKQYFSMVSVVTLIGYLPACGSNVLTVTEESEPAVEATRALELKKPSKAINTLEKALEKDPGNATYLSILSTAYAQRAGIEPLSVAQSIASQKQSSTSLNLAADNGSLVSLFGIMPAASVDNLSDIDRAVAILAVDLPRESWLAGDSFKFAIYQTSSTVMHLKALDTDGDGELSLEEILGLSSGESLVNQLSTAASVLAGSNNSASSAQAASIISSHRAEIEAMDGASTDEKLRNYLAKASGLTTSSTSSSP